MGTLSVQPPSGAVRSLTEIFVLLRNNAIQSRHIFADSGVLGSKGDERLSLVPLEEGGESGTQASRIPPEWVNMVDEVQYELSRVRSRLKELREAEQRHLSRPSFSDDSTAKEEKAIQTATAEITKMLAHSQRLIAHIKNAGITGKRGEATLQRNVTAALIAALQELTLELRTCQSTYMRQLQSREENFSQYFGPGDASADLFSAETSGPDWAEMDRQAISQGLSPAERTMAQIQAIEDSSEMVREREREVLAVSKSIIELNTLFKDLSGMVVEQGTVLDRIDFNIEQSTLRVTHALQSVRKAENYQRQNRKMHCIVCLSATIIVLLFLLLLKKSVFG